MLGQENSHKMKMDTDMRQGYGEHGCSHGHGHEHRHGQRHGHGHGHGHRHGHYYAIVISPSSEL
jgi:hypothetical protein